MAGATIFTGILPKTVESDYLDGTTPFTDTNTINADVTDQLGRTVTGDRIPVGKDKTDLGVYPTKDKPGLASLTTDSNIVGQKDVQRQELLRDLPLGDSPKKSFGDDFDRQRDKLNGQSAIG